jgi:hypothetical protein
MGVAESETYDVQSTDVVTVMKDSLRADECKWLPKFRHTLTDVVSIAVDTRHRLCEEPTVDVKHRQKTI